MKNLEEMYSFADNFVKYIDKENPLKRVGRKVMLSKNDYVFLEMLQQKRGVIMQKFFGHISTFVLLFILITTCSSEQANLFAGKDKKINLLTKKNQDKNNNNGYLSTKNCSTNHQKNDSNDEEANDDIDMNDAHEDIDTSEPEFVRVELGYFDERIYILDGSSRWEKCCGKRAVKLCLKCSEACATPPERLCSYCLCMVLSLGLFTGLSYYFNN